MSDPKLTVEEFLSLGDDLAPQPAEAPLQVPDLNFYEIAATTPTDPQFTSEDERLLREGRFSALERKYDTPIMEAMRKQYVDALGQVGQEQRLPRSAIQSVTDPILGAGARLLNFGLNTEAWIAGSPIGQILEEAGGITTNGQAGPIIAKQNKELNEKFIDPLYSEHLKNQSKLVGTQDTVDRRVHSERADAEAAAGKGEFFPALGAWLKRIGSDTGTGFINTASNPTMAMQGAADAAASMLVAGGLTKGLGIAGEEYLSLKSAEFLKRELAKGVERTAAEKLAVVGVEALRKKLTNASATVSVGLTEAPSAYQQQVEEVMKLTPDQLTQTSEDYRNEVARLQSVGLSREEAQFQARNWLANKTGQIAALGTGAVSAAVGHFLPEGAEDPLHVVSKSRILAGGLAKDTAKETAEEFLQGGSGQFIGNAVNQAYVDPNQDVLAGVGTQAGAGAFLGGLSAGGLKGPSVVLGTPAMAREGLAQVGKLAAKVGEKKLAAAEAESQASVQNLSQRATGLYEDREKVGTLAQAVRGSLTYDKETDRAMQTELNQLIGSPKIEQLPTSHGALPSEIQGRFTVDQTRAEAVNTAAELLVNEKDLKRQTGLALLLSDLMEPVRRFRELPTSLGPISENEEAMGTVREYQQMLADIEQLPAVQKALPKLLESLGNAKQKTPEIVAALATLDPNLGGKVTAAEVEQALTSKAGGTLTPSQKAALQGSAAVLKAREAMESGRDPAEVQKLLEQHLGGDRNKETSGRQALVETNPAHMETGKYSARQHTGRIIRAMVSGNTEKAQEYLNEFTHFVQHFQNKVEALNKSVQADGQRFSYQQYIGNGKFVDSLQNPKQYKHKDAWVNLKSQGSIQQATDINNESRLLFQLLKGMKEAFPELKVELPQQHKLDLISKAKAKPAPKVEKKPEPRPEPEEKVSQALDKALTPEPKAEQVEDDFGGLMDEEPSSQPAPAPVLESGKLIPSPLGVRTLADGSKNHSFNYINPKDGQEFQMVVHENADGSVIDVPTVGRADGKTHDQQAREGAAGSVGAREALKIAQELSQQFPNAKRLTGLHTTGANAKGGGTKAMEVDLERLRNRGQKKTEAPAPTPAPATPVAEVVPAPEPKIPSTVAELFPNLVQEGQAVRNFFAKGFKLKKDSTRLIGNVNPIVTVRDAISTEDGMKAFMGKALRGNLTTEIREAYQGFLTTTARNVAMSLNTRLETFLKSEWENGITFEQAIREGKHEVTLMQRGKPINAVEMRGGKLRYNAQLRDLAALAALQWQLSSAQREPVSKPDEIAEELGFGSAEEVPTALLEGMEKGQSLSQAKQSLASYIRRFWGVQVDSKQPMGYGEAISEAMAGELLSAMEDAEILQVHREDLKKYPQLNDNRVLDRYIPVNSEGPLNLYPELLEEMVIVEPELASYYGDDAVPVAERQLAKTQVQLSDKTKSALKNMQAQQFHLNLPLVRGVLALTENQLIELFGNVIPKDGESRYNKTHLASLQSQNVSLKGAFKELRRLVGEMENLATAKGTDLGALGKKYKYVVNSVNRIMMLGAHNPQANKLMREMILPTWSNLDLSNPDGDHAHYLMQAFAQAMGRKVHQFALQDNVTWARNALQNELAPVLDVLVSWLGTDTAFPVKAYNEALGKVRIDGKAIEPGPLVAMALTEMARMVKAGPEGLKTFRTPLYLEADGMTNGPFNSMGLLAVGDVRPEDIANWRRGGLSVGAVPMTADQLRKPPEGKADLYKAGMDAARVEVSRQRTLLKNEPDGEQMVKVGNAMFTAMSILLDSEVSLDEKGEWQFERGLGKNPSTVLVYGAGNPGIANKIVHRLITSYYEKLSAAARVSGTWEDAALEMFPGLPAAKALEQARTLKKAMDVLTKYVVSYNAKSESYSMSRESIEGVSGRVERNFRSFEFKGEELERLQENMLTLFVNPMKDGIRQVLGSSVFASGDLLVKATQMQSTLAREIYLDAINTKVAEKISTLSQELQKQGMGKAAADKKADSQVKSEFLSREELDQVWKDLKDVMPMVESDGQRFLIAQSALLKFWNKDRTKLRPTFQYSRTLDDKKETAPYADGLDGAGVAARPYLTIGMGDARMVRKIFEQAFEGSMQVYDGINIPVDKIPEYGARINQAALQAWQGNIFRSVSDTFERFLADPRVKKARGDKGIVDLLKKERVNLKELDDVREQLKKFARLQDARVKAISQFALSMDQMAGTYRPFVSSGRDVAQELEEVNDEEVARLINEEIYRILDEKVTASKPSQSPVNTIVHPSGVSVYTQPTMPQFLSWLQGKVNKGEVEVLTELIRSGALKDVRVVMGSQDQVLAYQKTEGTGTLARILERFPDSDTYGYYSPAENTVYVMDGTTETIVHELVHAGTLQVVLAHYRGQTLKPHAREAIERLERLMKLFMETDLNGEPDYDLTARKGVSNARGEIHSHNPFAPNASPTHKAVALNEFMAWTLANRDMARQLSRPDGTLSRLAKLSREAFAAIKKLLWGSKQPSTVAEDFLSQVRFNTAILAREVPSLHSMVNDLVTRHAARNGSLRMQEIMQAFGEKVASHLTETYSQDWIDTLGTNTLIGDEYRVAASVTQKAKRLFPMNDDARDAFQMMVLAFATEANINPSATIEAQRLYDHFLRNLHPHDLLVDTGRPQQDEADAQERYEFLSGHVGKRVDPSGRSTLLPVFLALATVHDGFRAQLAKLDLPEKHELHGKDKLDMVLEVAGQKMLDLLEDRLSGKDHPENVRVAIDQLMQGLIKSMLESQGALDNALEAVGETSYGWNSKLADMLSRLGMAAGRQGKALRQSGSPVVKGAGAVLQAVSFMSSQRDAEVIGEGVLAQMDKHPAVGSFFKEIMSDILGRVKSQAQVYDMIKRVRKLVAQTRQAYRENVPSVIASKFKQQPTMSQWNTLHKLMGRYDLASLLETFDVPRTLELVADTQALRQEIDRLEVELQSNHPQADRYLEKINQYVNFVRTGVRDPNLLRNAFAISELLGEPKDPSWVVPTNDAVQAIDQLITLQLLAQTPQSERDQYATLLREEREGLGFVLNYLKGQRKTEMVQASQGPARYNHYKGLLPYERKGRGHVVVADDSQHAHMVSLGYERRGPYTGSSIENRGASRSYWFSPEGGVKTTFNQGIAQNVQGTAYGVHTETGMSLEATAGRITDPVEVKLLAKRMARERQGTEVLSPIYGEDGAIVAFERSLDPAMLKDLEQEQHLAKMIGEWQGRQVEESWAGKINAELIEHLHVMWKKDMADKPSDAGRYVNLLDAASLDPVVRDAVSIMPRELKQLAEQRFGEGQFLVRQNMLNMTVGYRNASVGDLWTGTSRWSKEHQELARKAFMAMPGLGVDAYRKLVWAERNWQAAMASVRTNIVVRSIIVPAVNFMSGIYQLQVRQVPLLKTLKSVPGKVAEIEFYTKTMARKVELEAERFVNENNPTVTHRIDAQLQALNDQLRRLSIWPLLEAGEFSTISDVGQTAQELGTGNNTLVERLTRAVDALPPGLRDVARQGYMARDTALFQVLQKSVQYSDFVMKTIYFDHLTKVEKKSVKGALAVITEEFNNYDIPPGRTRGYVENMGLAWFLNYKIRAIKVGTSMIRKNPLNLLLYSLVPHPFSGGIPFTDNLVTSMFELSLGRSLGIGMALEPIALNPWYSLTSN